ncbi:DUF302 domain-containing protein [Spirochaeta lutea]|uniref:DUF302 domain-containing protein n=1 Tax=Spirochaeta lutea TaxID=1480694 RepID=A0A098QYY8_9SPIO|nr:DUF302 domain-containing protein [Spirochaeta lutea]KGE73120.1 hypothetical protein DC28_05350 [Spirochaeta lutea]
MAYYISTTLNRPFDESIEEVTRALQAEGFGVLSDIDVKATMKKKLDIDYHNYRILGACNPPYAHRALEAEHMIGTLLPCNVIVQEREAGYIEIAAVDPVSSMGAVNNESIIPIAEEIRQKLERVIQSLK